MYIIIYITHTHNYINIYIYTCIHTHTRIHIHITNFECYIWFVGCSLQASSWLFLRSAVQLRGLPYRATTQDVKDRVEVCSVNGLVLLGNSTGKPLYFMGKSMAFPVKIFPTKPIHWECQEPKKGVPYRTRPYFLGIFSEISALRRPHMW
jgi:hypothetical protein